MRERVNNISARLINDSFPSLQGKRILIIITWFRFFALSFWVPPWLRIVVISCRAKNFTDEEMTGLIAHELSHQERYISMGVFKYFSFIIRFIFSRRAQEEEEKATDRLTIEKGYGRNIYKVSQLSFSDKNHKKINSNYLTPEEIRAYSEQLGKW